MGVYLLQSEINSAGRTAVAGADSCVVVAHNVKDARAMAKAQSTGVSPRSWDDAECTEITGPSDVQGFVIVCSVSDPEVGTIAEVKIEATEGQSLDDLGIACAKALNECGKIHGAAYNIVEHVLTVASAAGGDNLGHATLFCVVYPTKNTTRTDASIPGCVKARVHLGEPGDSLTVLLAGPEYTLPRKVVAFGSGS